MVSSKNGPSSGSGLSNSARAGSSASATSAKRGCGTPAARRRWRIACLSRAAAAAATGLALRPRRAATAAATTVVRSSTATTASIGRPAAKRATCAAAPSGSRKSSVSRWSGTCASNVLGCSDAHTRSTPRPVAASTNAWVRYVVVGRSSSSRADGLGTWRPADRTAGRLGFARGVVGVGAGRVVRRVEDLVHLGQLFLDEALDAGLQRDVGRAAPMAAPAHLEVDAVVLDVDELDEAAVTGDRRIDHRVDQLLHPGLEVRAHGCTSQTGTVPEIPPRANWPWVGSAQQNQGSVRRGGRGRPAGGGGGGGGGAP